MSEISEERAGAAIVVLQEGVLRELKERNAATRGRVKSLMETGETLVATIDGVRIGSVQKKRGVKSATVVDRAAFEAWIYTYRPDAVEEVLPVLTDQQVEAAAQVLVRQLAESAGVMNQDRELARKVLVAALPTERIHPASEKAILEALKLGKTVTMVDPETGEETTVTAVPGVRVVTAADATPGFAVSPDAETLAPIVAELLQLSGLLAVGQ